MTLEDLLTMRTGFDWDESIPYEDPKNPCMQMENSEDWIQFVLDFPMKYDPGTKFAYNSGASQLLSGIIKITTGETIDKYTEKHLFGPLGITDYYWKITPNGLPDTEGGLYLKTRDLAKIGYLYLLNGLWGNKRILQEDWVSASVTPFVNDTSPENETNNTAYGYQWWLNPYSDNPDKYIYTCSGYGGQGMYVIPEYNLVGVINCWNLFDQPARGRYTVMRDFVNAILEAVK